MFLPECINILATIILLSVCEQIHVRIDLGLVVSVSASGDNRIGLDLAQITRFVFVQICPGAIRTQQLKIIVQCVPCPPFTTLPASILEDRCVLDEGHITAALHQTTERSSMAIVILRSISTTISKNILLLFIVSTRNQSLNSPKTVAMTQVAHIVVRHSRIVLGANRSRNAGLGKVLGSRSNAIAAVRPDPTVRYQIGHRIHPASGRIDSRMTCVLALQIGQLGVRILFLGQRNHIVLGLSLVVDLRNNGHQIVLQTGRVHIAGVQNGHVRLAGVDVAHAIDVRMRLVATHFRFDNLGFEGRLKTIAKKYIDSDEPLRGENVKICCESWLNICIKKTHNIYLHSMLNYYGPVFLKLINQI